MRVNGEDITVEIGASTQKATDGMNKLIGTLGRFMQAVSKKFKNPVKEMENFDASKFEKNLNAVDKSIERTQKKIYAFKNAIKNANESQVSSKPFESSLKEQENILQRLEAQRKGLISQLSGSVAGTKGFADSVNKATDKILKQQSLWKGLGNAGKSAADKVSNAFKNMAGSVKSSIKSAFFKIVSAIGGRTLGALSKAVFTVLQPIALAIKGVVNLGTKLGGILLKGASAAGRGILSLGKTFITLPFKKTIKDVSEFGKKIGTLASQFKRVLFYRAIRKVIKEIGDAFREGTQNLYYYSQGIGGEFARSMDMAATSMLYFKNSVGAAVAPIVNALAPVLDMLVDKIVAVINAINQLIAKLTGATYWTKAIKHPKAYADAVSGAGKAAKEALRYLAPFDELNVLPSDRGSSGGGAGAAEDYSSMFEEMTAFDSAISDFAERIKAAINAGDWRGAGKILADKLNEMVSGWDSRSLGAKIGKKINNAIEFAYGFLKNFDFRNLGVKIADGINGALENINFETAGRLFTRKFTALFDFLIGIIEGLDWSLVGKSIVNYLRGAWDEASEWLDSIDWASLGENLWKDVKDLIEGIDFASLSKSFFGLLGSAIGASAKGIGGFIGGIGQDIADWWSEDIKGTSFSETMSNLWEAVKTAIGDVWTFVKENIIDPFMEGLLGKDNWPGLDEVGKNIWEGFTNGLNEFFDDPVKYIKEHIVDPFVNGVKDLLGIHSPSTVFAEIGDNVVQGLWDGIDTKWSEFKKWFEEKWEALKKWWKELELPAFKIKKPHLSWTSTPATGWIAKTLSALGLPTSLPKLSVQWYAKGGIIDKASLIGAGEAGKEAIIPLERNTEWISKVAHEMREQASRQNASPFGGDIAGDLEDANGVVVDAIYAAAAQILQGMRENKSGGLDYRAITTEVTRLQKRRAMATGV